MQPDLKASSPASAPWASTRAQPDEGVLGPYVNAVRAHLLLVAAALFAALVGSVGLISQQPTVYEAQAELLVTPFPSDQVTLTGLPLLTEAGDPTRTIQTAASLVDSHNAAAVAAQRLGADWTQRRVRSATKVLPLGQTNILAVTATAESAALAARVANAFTRSVLDVRTNALRKQAAAAIPGVQEQLKGLNPASPAAADVQRRLTLLNGLSVGSDPTLSISELAVAPANSKGSPRWLVLALAALAGLIVGISAALLLENLSHDVIRTERDLDDLFPLPILARVPDLHLRRSDAGVPQLTPAVREAFRTLQVQLEIGGKHRRTIMMVSASRGDGTTRAAAAFALELADAGTTVVLVDADLRRGTLRAMLGMDPNGSRPTWPAVAPLAQLLQETPDLPLLKLLDFEALTTVDQRNRKRLSELISESKKVAEYVIVDAPPLGEVSDALTLLDVVDDVILVSELRKTRRPDLEVTRDLLMRADARPAGSVVIQPRSVAIQARGLRARS